MMKDESMWIPAKDSYCSEPPPPPRIRKLRVRADSEEELKKKIGARTYQRAQLDPNFIVIRQGKWPKRNDLCPCGSDKKFKKCCMRIAQGIDALDDDRDLPLEPVVSEECVVAEDPIVEDQSVTENLSEIKETTDVSRVRLGKAT